MPSFAFWNIGRKDIGQVICDFVRSSGLDFIALCESGIDPLKVVSILNRYNGDPYFYISGVSEKRFQIFSRFNPAAVTVRHDGPRFIILNVHPPALPKLNVMLIHSPSPANFWNDPSIDHFLLMMADELSVVELMDNNANSLVVGDLNQNPFGNGIISARGFHAIMDSREVRKGHKVIQQKQYPYFYNPMWNLMGDAKGVPGTHYFRGPGFVEQQWHMLDQILLRPSLLDVFEIDKLAIIESINNVSILNRNNRPEKNKFSDHLPLYFELNP